MAFKISLCKLLFSYIFCSLTYFYHISTTSILPDGPNATSFIKITQDLLYKYRYAPDCICRFYLDLK